jgi:flagellar hook-associated protein 2
VRSFETTGANPETIFFVRAGAEYIQMERTTPTSNTFVTVRDGSNQPVVLNPADPEHDNLSNNVTQAVAGASPASVTTSAVTTTHTDLAVRSFTRHGVTAGTFETAFFVQIGTEFIQVQRDGTGQFATNFVAVEDAYGNPVILNPEQARNAQLKAGNTQVVNNFQHTQVFQQTNSNNTHTVTLLERGTPVTTLPTTPSGWITDSSNNIDGWTVRDANGNYHHTRRITTAMFSSDEVGFEVSNTNIRSITVDGQQMYVVGVLANGGNNSNMSDWTFYRVERVGNTEEFQFHRDAAGDPTILTGTPPNPSADPPVPGSGAAWIAFNGPAPLVQNVTYTQRMQTTININGTNIDVFSDDTVNSLLARVNNNTQVGVHMSFNSTEGFTLTARNTGAAIDTGLEEQIREHNRTRTVVLGDDPSGLLNKLFGANPMVAGTDTRIRVDNGTDTWYETSTSNTVIMRNTEGQITHTIALNNVSEGDSFNVETRGNSANAIKAVRDFVESYNALLLMLNDAHSTNRPRTTSGGQRSFFEPLTEAERKEMSDREIERWEEQARKGLLHRDNTLRNIQAQLRRQVSEGVLLPDGSRIFLHQIGITADGTFPGQAAHQRNMGLLRIDEERLEMAVQNNPHLVEGLFTSYPPAPIDGQQPLQGAARNARLGLAHRLAGIVHEATRQQVGSITRLAGDNDAHHTNRFSRQIATYDRRMDRMQDWLIRRENQLFRQFSLMEQAMSRSHQQMDSLFMFGTN